MWTISQLKQRGQSAIHRNYWKSVLVALILSVVVAGGSGGSAGALSSSMSTLSTALSNYTSKVTDGHSYKVSADMERGSGEGVAPVYATEDFEDLLPYLEDDLGDNYDFYWDSDEFGYDYDEDDDWDDASIFDNGAAIAFIMIFLIFFFVVLIFASAVGIALDVLILNPLEMGVRRFFYQNLIHSADVKEVAYGFDRSYKNVITTMFFRDLFTFLWGLLFIIPGIIKSYEYRMIPYILSEHPDMPRETAFATSKEMMNGNKWKAFVLDLSFIGWWILSAFTAGLLNVFYVHPYYNSTCAALYEALKYEKGNTSNGYVQPATDGAAPVVAAEAPMTSDQPVAAAAYTDVQANGAEEVSADPMAPSSPQEDIFEED